MTRTVASKFTASDASSPALHFGGFACERREVFLQAPSRRIAEAVRDAMPVLFDLSKKKRSLGPAVLGHWLFGFGP